MPADQRAGSSADDSTSGSEWTFEEAPRRESCVKYFDALWFCYCEY